MNLSLLKKLREETGCSIMECKKAIEKAQGDIKEAKEYLAGFAKIAAKEKRGRKTHQGIVASYIHVTKRVGSLVELTCETDFVANTPEFQKIASEIALHVAGMSPKNVRELLSQPYVREPSVSVKEFVSQAIGQLGEHIEVKKFVRYEIK